MEGFWNPERVPGEAELAIWRVEKGGEPLICLHGITAQHRSFNALARHLGEEYELVGVDLRGRGDSEKPESGYGLEAHAADVMSVLDHLGLESAVLAGHSMGGFVGVRAALSYPERVRALVLLDGGWPRPEASEEDMTEKERAEAEEIRQGLERAYSRLDMVFESPDDYLNFWFPDQGITMRDLPPELADYYRYDLGEVEDGYQPKASLNAVEEDSPQISSEAPTAGQMRSIRCPVALIRTTEGFLPGSSPFISGAVRARMDEALDLRSDTLLEGANHYTMMWGEHARRAAEAIRDFLRETG
ncbi:MAG: alpha/beta fold hydrolase [Rubrobacteraceae bacterium]